MLLPPIFVALCNLLAVLPMDGLFPREENVHISQISHGISAYFLENTLAPKQTTIHIVTKDGKQLTTQEDFSSEDLKNVEQFFSFSKETITSPSSLAVIAVGDFSKEKIEPLIKAYFEGLTYLKEDQQSAKMIASTPLPSVKLSYKTASSPLATLQDLKQLWSRGLIFVMLQQRAEKMGFNEKNDERGSLFPLPKKAEITIANAENRYLEILAALLIEAETIKKNGFTKQEFAQAKEHFYAKHKAFVKKNGLADNAARASFYAQHCFQNPSLPSFAAFLEFSPEIVENLTLEEIDREAILLLTQSQKCVEVCSSVAQSKVQQVMDWVDLYGSSPPGILLCGGEDVGEEELLSNKAVRAPVDPYEQLPLDENEKKIIAKILTVMADNNIIKLGFRKKSLEKKGKMINHVHPLRFIGYVFSDEHLRYCMNQIKKSSFKWDGFIDGFAGRMKEEAGKDNLEPHIPGFCRALNVDPKQVREHIEDRDWSGLVRFLMKKHQEKKD